jgi:hypothetical protein
LKDKGLFFVFIYNQIKLKWKKEKLIMANEEKVTKLTDLKQLVNKKKNGFIELEFGDGSKLKVEINGLSKAQFEAINEKYDDMKESQPETFVKDGRGGGKWIKDSEDSEEYKSWMKKNKAIENLRICEMVLAFLAAASTLEGSLEDKVKFLNENFLLGHFYQIIEAGMEISGLKTNKDQQIEQAKN